MRIPTKEEIDTMRTFEPMWSYDKSYNQFWLMIGFGSIVIDTDAELDSELAMIREALEYKKECESKNNDLDS